MPSEQPPTRVESGTSIEEAERLAAIETDAVFGPAQPQPREETRIHELKTLPGFIDAIEESGKTFEVRNNDRRFKTGDTLHLREYDPDEGYSGREIHRRVGYVLDGFPGIEKGYCVMALEPAQPEQPRGERDDLAERLREDSTFIEEALGAEQAAIIIGHLDEAASALRASTHPEQSARVDQRMLASQMETNLRMNRWREHLGDDPLDGFGGRGPAEYHYMATHEPEGPGLTRFGNLGFRPAPPRGEGDDLAARLEDAATTAQRIGAKHREEGNSAASSYYRGQRNAYNEAAELARASTHPEQWVSGDDREWLLWITSYVLNRHEFTDSAATDARAALTRIATAIKQPASPTPTEQGEDRTRVEWHDGIEHGDELALRQLAADIGCGIPYGCQPSVGKWYAAALDRVLDRLLPLDPAPEQGEARAFERGVREACRLMRHVDTLDKVPGARDGLPHLNPLWDGSAYVEDALVGPFADRIQRPAPEGEGEAS